MIPKYDFDKIVEVEGPPDIDEVRTNSLHVKRITFPFLHKINHYRTLDLTTTVTVPVTDSSVTAWFDVAKLNGSSALIIVHIYISFI